MELLGDRRAANQVAAFQHPHFQSGGSQISRADQAIVAAADDQDVVISPGLHVHRSLAERSR